MPTSGRYQSRFFSFLSQQSLRLRDKTSQTWRQMKVATAWGVQIVLYPVYLAFQASRLVSRQLQQTVRQVLPQLRAVNEPLQTPDRASEPRQILTADTPIRNMLEAIEPILQSLPATQIVGQLPANTASAIETSPASPASHPPIHSSASLPAIASLLENHHLVLITHENQILDILTADQQLQLQRRMSWEMVTYWQQRRRLANSAGATKILPLPSDRPNALLPIRAFYRLMTWMQTSPIAIAANLFQESRLAALHSLSPESTAVLPAAPTSALRSAEVPWLSLQDAFSGLFDRSAQPAARPSQSLKARLQAWWHDRTESEIVHLPPATDSSPASPASPPAASSWLTWEDLFGSRVSAKPTSEWELFETLPQSDQKLVKRRTSSVRRRDRSSQAVSAPELEVAQPIVLATEDASTLAAPAAEPANNTLSNTWIETEVSLVKYEKHPLEQLLEWLDRGMLWLEEKITSTFRWLRDRLGAGKGEE